MPHLILILPDGGIVEVEHDGEGNKIGQAGSSVEDVLHLEHPPTKIIIREPSMELTEIILKACERYYWKLNNK